jgi:hypothetical protein
LILFFSLMNRRAPRVRVATKPWPEHSFLGGTPKRRRWFGLGKLPEYRKEIRSRLGFAKVVLISSWMLQET